MDSQQVGEENSPISRVQISKNDVPKEAFPGGNNINIVWSFFFFFYICIQYICRTISKHCHYIIITMRIYKPFGDFTVRYGKSPFSKTLNHHFIYFDGRSHSIFSSFRSKVKALELRGASKPMGDNIWVANNEATQLKNHQVLAISYHFIGKFMMMNQWIFIGSTLQDTGHIAESTIYTHFRKG